MADNIAYIKTLKDNELIGGTDNRDVYPVSTTQAIFSQKPDGTLPEGIKHQKLEDRLFDGEEDARELHRKAEKLVAYIDNDKAGQTLEISEGTVNTMNLSGYAYVETYGDEPSQAVTTEQMTVKTLKIIAGSAETSVPGSASGNNWIGTYNVPNVVGSYKARFDVTYNGISKYAESTTNVNLRKYFGFASTQPTDPSTLDASNFSNSVGCTVTIPSNGTGFKRIYLSVPNGMTITRVVQPDALNAPLAVTQVGTITRVVNGQSYTYKLYQSDDMIDSSVSKRLTIS